MNKEIVIKNNFSVKSYTKATLNVLLPKSRFWFLITLYSLLLINGVRIITTEILSNNFNFDILMKPEIYVLFFPAVFYILMIRTLKTNFKADPKNKEIIYHILNNNFFEIKGESFTTKFLWTDLLIIKEAKDFFLVFIAKNSFLAINKSDLKDNQYNELKELFNSIDIKKNF